MFSYVLVRNNTEAFPIPFTYFPLHGKTSYNQDVDIES